MMKVTKTNSDYLTETVFTGSNSACNKFMDDVEKSHKAEGYKVYNNEGMSWLLIVIPLQSSDDFDYIRYDLAEVK